MKKLNFENVLYLVILFLMISCAKKEVEPEKTPLNFIAGQAKKEWVVSSTTVQHVLASGQIHELSLELDCEIDDIWVFQSSGGFQKFDNLTRCAGVPTSGLKLETGFTFEPDYKAIIFKKWKFAESKERENMRFVVEVLNEKSLVISATNVFANTGKLTIQFAPK
jgi:hypothetical protein